MNLFKSIHPSYEGNILKVCKSVLDIFDVRSTKTFIKKIIDNHLDPSSLLAVTDILSEYGVETVAVKKGNYQYSDFELPFICCVQEEGWSQASFVLVKDVTNDNIKYLDPSDNHFKYLSSTAFGNIDKGIILLLDESNKRDEIDYRKHLENERTSYWISKLPLLLISMAVMFPICSKIFLGESIPWENLLFLTTSLVGVFVSILLLWHEVDAFNPFIREVCGGSGKKTNCHAVLASKGATFLGVSWSIWGASYFFTFFITQLFFFDQSTFYNIWIYLSILVSSYIFYSLYYQAQIVKRWCPLCLVVQGILLINAIVSIVRIYLALPIWPRLSIGSLFNITMFGICLFFLIYHAVPVVKQARESRGYQKRWKRLQFNPDIFQTLLLKTNKVDIPAEEMGIVIGNPNASVEIIKVCNPYCGPCSKAHPEIENIIRNNEDIRVRIIFTTYKNTNSNSAAPIRHLLSIEEKYGAEKVKIALDDWYLSPNKDYESFAKKYPIDIEKLEEQQQEVVAMTNWYNKMKIRGTPTFFINGYHLPESYEIKDLKNFF